MPLKPALSQSDPLPTSVFLAIFSAVFLPMFLAAVDQTLLATATPAIVADLGGLRQASWITIGYMLAMAASVPIYGWLGDNFGRAKILMIALVVFALGSIVSASAGTMDHMIAGRILQGMGGGGLMSLSQSLIGELVPIRQRARFQGYFAAMFTLASVGGPVIGGFVVHAYSWHWLFWANIPLAMLAVWRLNGLHKRSVKPVRQGRFDLLGVVLFPTIITALLYWLSAAGQEFAWLSATSFGFAVFVVVGILGLLLWERRLASPFLPLDLLAKKAIYMPLLTAALFAACLFAMIFFLPIYLQVGLHTNPAKSGLLLMPMTFGIVTGSTLAGRLLSKDVAPKWLPSFGMALAFVGLLLIGLVPPNANLIGGLGVLVGVGLGTVMPSVQLVVQSVSGKARLSQITAMVSLCRSMGAAIGTALFSLLLYGLLPFKGEEVGIEAMKQLPTESVHAAFQYGFIAASTVALCAAIVGFLSPATALKDHDSETAH
ncbi:MFS transporter [Shewanella sp. CG12_big_fil_rev_8_21_14_0_65_47_15]|uniref:MFS transporter n=1 Tax=Shewanella sp. CG12_big_fil_rev_8_21_14_0_65_47_15 TaxID=1975537 RepID=UPI000CB2099A|nr:MFS transporter [Shewanella sp. CG12_big_fil_rev_8_21_14_0_65_47_15]PIW63139.1 MAG: MFS transporter [Shewanella sp. CG12_big_fil_rev_8_21_14_0_65_47_15]